MARIVLLFRLEFVTYLAGMPLPARDSGRVLFLQLACKKRTRTWGT